MNQKQIKEFQKSVWDFYYKHKRELPWRNTNDPYAIFISEVMLQQTQVARVIPKYTVWMKKFPDFKSLAGSSLEDILHAWSGLGYNRRAKFLLESARIIHDTYNDKVSQDPNILVKLPGIGRATAASIVVFSYNKAFPFIETNIRRVFIHTFFQDQSNIQDNQILELVKNTIDQTSPREWYYALMDYGSYLAKVTENPNRKSKSYTKQSPFKGSIRQIRGHIIRELLAKKKLSTKELALSFDPLLLDQTIQALAEEKIIVVKKDHFVLADL